VVAATWSQLKLLYATQPSRLQGVAPTVTGMGFASVGSVLPEIEAPAPVPSPPGAGRGFLFWAAAMTDQAEHDEQWILWEQR
jgi:hypothetical protein